MNMHDERRAIPEARIAELRKLALSSDDAERKVAQRLLRQIAPELHEREEADAREGE